MDDEGIGDGSFEEVDFSNLEAAKAWFETQKPEDRALVASRASLDVIENLRYSPANEFDAMTLASFRSLLIASVHGLGYTQGFDGILNSEAQRTAMQTYSGAVKPDIELLALYSADCASFAFQSPSLAAMAVSFAEASGQMASPFLRSVQEIAIHTKRSLAETTMEPELSEETNSERCRGRESFVDILSKDSGWDFWRGWIGAIWAGTFEDWDLAHEVAQIEDEVWEGSDALAKVAAEINRIQAKHEVIKALEKVPMEAQPSLSNRHGIGGNAPPDQIEDFVALSKDVTIVWAGVETLKQEVASETPDRVRVQSAIDQLSKGLATCIKWLGRKGDLTVDTIIKWGVPAGCAYLLGNTAKIQALIEAALKWIQFL